MGSRKITKGGPLGKLGFGSPTPGILGEDLFFLVPTLVRTKKIGEKLEFLVNFLEFWRVFGVVWGVFGEVWCGLKYFGEDC